MKMESAIRKRDDGGKPQPIKIPRVIKGDNDKRKRSASPVPPFSVAVETTKRTPADSKANQSKSPTEIIRKQVQSVELPDPQTTDVNPDTYLLRLVEAAYGAKLRTKPSLETEDFFPQVTEEQVAAYTVQVVTATRDNNVQALKDLHEQGHRLDCVNRFGESLLNNACRRGFDEMVHFLLETVHINVRIRDDYGRTPLHDACWHPTALLKICGWLVDQDPTLLLFTDKRGHTPFQYARPRDWPAWRQFLYDHRASLRALVEPETLELFQ